MQYVTFVQSIFAFYLALSFQVRLPFSAQLLLGSARKREREIGRKLSLFF